MDNSHNKTKDFFLNLFFPKFCLGCQKEGTYLCDDCRTLLDISEFNYCLCEANGFPKRILPHQDSLESLKCENCKNKELAGLYFALSYKETGLTKKLIRQFKYPPYLKDLSLTLAGILAEHFILTNKNTHEFWKNSVLIPVPLSKAKLKERGYNQSEELAKELAKIAQVQVLTDILIKVKETPSQAKLKKEERQKNLRGAFAIKNCGTSDIPQFIDKKVFLVDDVYTTGSTMEECANVLKEAGAKSVWGIVVAREG